MYRMVWATCACRFFGVKPSRGIWTNPNLGMTAGFRLKMFPGLGVF